MSLRLLVAIVGSLVVSLICLAGSASATTGPQHQRYVYLLITDKKIVFHNDDLTSLTRGSYLRFFIFNEGKEPHQLSIQGKKTPVVKPGGRGETGWILFNDRGLFRFFDPLHKSLFGYVRIL
jgi:hypothetical protein